MSDGGLIEKIADEISGISVGEGYYSQTIGINAALEAAKAIAPLLNRVRAEAAVQALREAADEIEMSRNEPGLVKLDVQYAGYYTGIRSGMESAARAIRNRIEQNSEGNET